MECCRIQWIDKDGKPTPDTNPAIGVVYREAYSSELHGRVIRFDCPDCGDE